MPLCYVILSKVGPCSLPSCFMLFSWAPSSPQCCLYNLLEGQLENHWSLGGFHTSTYSGIRQSGSPRSSTCLGICYLKTCHSSTCSGIRQSRGPRRSTCLDLPRDQFLGGLPASTCPGIWSPGGCHALSAWGSAPWPGDAWLSGCNNTG